MIDNLVSYSSKQHDVISRLSVEVEYRGVSNTNLNYDFWFMEKGNQLMDKASSAAQSAKETVQEAGSQVQMKASEAADAVKDATGMNK
uniref:Uncharacterized protein n=1 Tax=Lactuca sativa TaxID=4236 RepID=A0A9R1VSB7_LACSA|nr:hypothetical protein LSAT_V11C400223800 [Lactuca sativa]